MNKELKNCPFCGSESEINSYLGHGTGDKVYEPRCKVLGCIGRNTGKTFSSEAEAIEAWNTRHIEAPTSGVCADAVGFAKSAQVVRSKGASGEQWEFATLLGKALSLITRLVKEVGRLKAFVTAVKKWHNGYDPNNEFCSEPNSPEQALQDLRDEWDKTEDIYATQLAEKGEENERLTLSLLSAREDLYTIMSVASNRQHGINMELNNGKIPTCDNCKDDDCDYRKKGKDACKRISFDLDKNNKG